MVSLLWGSLDVDEAILVSADIVFSASPPVPSNSQVAEDLMLMKWGIACSIPRKVNYDRV